MKRITREPWFGPKRFIGWGWSIRSWQGAAISIPLVAGLVVARRGLHGRTRLAVTAAVLGAFLVVVLLTGDPPGGPRKTS